MYYLRMLLISTYFFLQTPGFAQIEREYNFPIPSIGEKTTAPVLVYYPVGYNENDSIRYPLFIYLHGARGWDGNGMSIRVKGPATKLIGNGEIEPAVFVYPTLWFEETPQKPQYWNLHMFTNSEYFGGWEDVITKDLISWLKSTTDFNLKDKLILERNSMVLAGFSMGGTGAVNICARNPDMFLGAISHGGLLSLAGPILEEQYIPPVLAQTSKNTQGEYEYKAENGGSSIAIFGLSAAFNDLDASGKIQFLLHPSGDYISSILDVWRTRADPYIIMRLNKDIYTDVATSPYFFIEIGDQDEDKRSNDRFVINDWPKLNVEDGYLKYVVTPNAGHDIENSRPIEAIKWMSDRMESLTTNYTALTNDSDIRIYPNKLRRGEKINVFLDITHQGDALINMINPNGAIITKSIRKVNTNGTKYIDINAPEVSGVYYVQVVLGNNKVFRKIVVF